MLNWQFGCNLWVDHAPADHVNQVQEGQEKPREHGGGVELDDRLAGHRRIDNDHHRRRNQDAQRAAGSDHAGSKPRVITGVEHGPHRNHAHQHHHRAHQSAGNAPERADDQCGDGEGTRQMAEGELHAVEHLVHQRTAFHHITHQYEQGNG